MQFRIFTIRQIDMFVDFDILKIPRFLIFLTTFKNTEFY